MGPSASSIGPPIRTRPRCTSTGCSPRKARRASRKRLATSAGGSTPRRIMPPPGECRNPAQLKPTTYRRFSCVMRSSTCWRNSSGRRRPSYHDSGVWMKLFTFDFIPYARNLKGSLGYPVGRQHFDPEIAAQTYHNHVEQFQVCEEVGFDGVSLNEHHGSPYGLDNSPNVFLSYIARATKHIKLTMLGNLLPLHAHPLR